MNHDLARDCLRRIVERAARYMSDDHFTVDGTLIEAWALRDVVPISLQDLPAER